MSGWYPGHSGMVPYPYGDDYGDDDDDYGWPPMHYPVGGPRGYDDDDDYDDFFSQFGRRGFYNFGGFPMVGHHNIYNCWPPFAPREPKKKDEDKKKGPSHKKAFFLVRQKPSKGKSSGGGGGSGGGDSGGSKKKKKQGDWRGYCEHMPAKTHVGKAAPPFWYLFS